MITPNKSQRGFTIAELLVVISLIGILSVLAFPRVSRISGQMHAAEDARTLAADLSELRAEAIRLRTSVRVTFTSSGYRWDIDDDGTTEGTRTLRSTSAWSGGTPTAVVFNGLGLTRGISTQQTISIKNANYVMSFSINHNGHIKI